ncbi:SHOCT domain-containing protein [Paraburkholderia tagetis]|jgi:putative membrane protein|uniref:SHOCT domain-containing protein n=1 Tax=Paraburkholderia tagetis TaxID=2913261 RepID=A0A9X1RG96_9BURK|nr:SHOCT domain-containing protein [Paraburkholderia tagetis]MBU6488509.1 SHOCT domain-containing protein [Burkholderiales bacterium]MCG5072361.1 SHOCT domain-containing protein [Paraburkholderia tagetis]
MMWNWNGFGGWGMGFGFLFMILVWALVILGIVTLVRWLTWESRARREQNGRVPPRDKTPLEIVQERYARGEINREEYEQKKRDLGS